MFSYVLCALCAVMYVYQEWVYLQWRAMAAPPVCPGAERIARVTGPRVRVLDISRRRRRRTILYFPHIGCNGTNISLSDFAKTYDAKIYVVVYHVYGCDGLTFGLPPPADMLCDDARAVFEYVRAMEPDYPLYVYGDRFVFPFLLTVK